MTRKFPDELLSAHLDGELSEAERAEVERHLAASPADRQLFEDLKSLRGEMASLPRAKVSPDFADRVVRAAMTEAEQYNEARGVVSQAPPVQRHSWRRWKFGAAAASAVALAACILLVVLLRRNTMTPQPGEDRNPVAIVPKSPEEAAATVVALSDQLLAALTSAAPKNRDAVVLRLKVGKDVSVAEALDEALGKMGIGTLEGSVPSPAELVREAYARNLAANGGSEAAAGAIFIEAPLASLQGAMTELATAVHNPLQLETYGKLVLQPGEERAEGESSTAPFKAFLQHLDASHFRLAARPPVVEPPSTPLVGTLKADQPVRVLLLIDAE